MKVKVINTSNQEVGDVELPEEIFLEKFNSFLIYDAFKNELANKRQGNSSTKTRGVVAGTTKKPWRQKGTGNARAGSNKSPLWIGGGVIFGPHKRSYRYKLNDKSKRKALYSLLSHLLKSNKIKILDDLQIDGYKTKVVYNIFSDNNLSLKKKVLLVVNSGEKNDIFLKRSAANVPWLKVVNVESLELNSLYNSNEIFFTKKSIEKLILKFSPKSKAEVENNNG